MDYRGITTIFGLNKDAGGTGASYTNASGKSLLFTAIPEIAFGTPPSGKDQTKHTKTEIGLEFRGGDNGRELTTFVKTYGKTKKFQVTRNSKDINVRKLDYAEKKLQALLGGSEEDFYTTRYIDNTIPHPLIAGSPTVRQEFFVRMFNLEDIDAIRGLLLAQLREVQKVSATYKEVKSMFKELKAKALPLEDIRAKQERIVNLKAKQEKLLSRINKYQVVRDLLRFEKQNKDLIEDFYATTSLANFESEVFNTDQMIKSAKERKEAAQEWEVYSHLRKVYKRTKAPLVEKIKSLIGDDYEEKEVKHLAHKYNEAKADYDSLDSELSSIVLDEPKERQKPSIDRDMARKEVYRLEAEAESASVYKDGKCPTCGAPHKSRKFETIKGELQDAEDSLQSCEKYLTYREKLKVYNSNLVRYKELKPRVKELGSHLATLKANADAYALLGVMPERPSKPQGEPFDLAELEAKLEKYTEKKAKLRRFKDILEQLKSLSTLTREQREKAKGFDNFTENLGRISNKLSNLIAEVTSGLEAIKQLKGLATRGKVLAKQAEDEPILQTLIEAYSKKGLKKIRIQMYAELLQRQANKYVRLFFAEDIKFEFKYGTKLEVLAHRKKGKKLITTDVKRLSGAEKRMLTLVLVVASISLLPKNKRSPFLILDEPESNLGPAALHTFIRSLPVLNKVIPHIIVITPNSNLDIAGSRMFTVVKRNGISTLIKGKVGAG